jgi:PBP1b-binding outer membrane lipoprotein LpoB
MKTLLLVAFLFTGCASKPHSPSPADAVPQMQFFRPNPFKPVKITDCHGKLAAIYLDSDMTTPIANPVMPDSYGRVGFWAAQDVCYSTT